MVEKTFDKHISAEFNRELNDLRSRVLAMGGLVEQQIQSAMESFCDTDVQKAEAVIQRDRDVNAMEVSIDETVTHILARRQPAAVDLRMLVAIIKVITDLERIGDEAEKIARMSIELRSRDFVAETPRGIIHLAAIVSDMLKKSLDAFARLDSKSAAAAALLDGDADKEFREILRSQMTRMMEDPKRIGASLDMIWAAKALERIGDHSKNICEYVIYLVEGKDVRHLADTK